MLKRNLFYSMEKLIRGNRLMIWVMNQKGQILGGRGLFGLRVGAQRTIGSLCLGAGIVLILGYFIFPGILIFNLNLSVIGMMLALLGLGLSISSG